MDAIVKERLNTRIIVYPFRGYEDGNKTFGIPYVLYGYVFYRERINYKDTATEPQDYTIIYFDGKKPQGLVMAEVVGYLDADDKLQPVSTLDMNYMSGRFVNKFGRIIQFANIKTEDEVIVPGQARLPIRTIKSYQGLLEGTELVEVIV